MQLLGSLSNMTSPLGHGIRVNEERNYAPSRLKHGCTAWGPCHMAQGANVGGSVKQWYCVSFTRERFSRTVKTADT